MANNTISTVLLLVILGLFIYYLSSTTTKEKYDSQPAGNNMPTDKLSGNLSGCHLATHFL